MESYAPEQLITKHQEQQESRGELAEQALEWFLQNDVVGQLYPRLEVVGELADHMGVASDRANMALSDTVGDIVDPVQQVATLDGKYVGVIEYTPFTQEGAYGYVDFDDRKGRRKRVVCAKCVEDNEYDENISHATQGEGTSSTEATWDQLLNKITSHYVDSHDEGPSEIQPGAALLSGTTIDGNTSFHAGNDGPGSGLDADTVDGVEASSLGSDVSNDGTKVTSSATDLNFTANLSASDDGDGTSTVAIDQGSGSGLDADTLDGVEAAELGGGDIANSGTVVTTSTDEIDFTDNLVASDDGDGTSSVTLASNVSAELFEANELFIHGKTLEAGKTVTIGSDSGAVVSEEYKVNGTLNIEQGGSLTVAGERAEFTQAGYGLRDDSGTLNRVRRVYV